MSDGYFDEIDGGDETDDFDEMNCGSFQKGQCDLAGTEYCDWSCPIRNEVFPPRHKRKPKPAPLLNQAIADARREMS